MIYPQARPGESLEIQATEVAQHLVFNYVVNNSPYNVKCKGGMSVMIERWILNAELKALWTMNTRDILVEKLNQKLEEFGLSKRGIKAYVRVKVAPYNNGSYRDLSLRIFIPEPI